MEADCANTLAIGALDRDGQVDPRSTHQHVDVAAPGDAIANITPNGGIQVNGGTSDAAILTAGAIALIRSRHPQWMSNQVRQHLIATLTDRPTAGASDPGRGYGVLNLLPALSG